MMSLFDEVVNLTEPYLGPAAHRFVSRQIAFHFGKAPESLEAGDLPELAEWASATLSFLTEDEDTVTEYENNILGLAGNE
jgi:hypothetical protein